MENNDIKNMSYEDLCRELQGIPGLNPITPRNTEQVLTRQRSARSNCERNGGDSSKLNRRIEQLERLLDLLLTREQAKQSGRVMDAEIGSADVSTHPAMRIPSVHGRGRLLTEAARKRGTPKGTARLSLQRTPPCNTCQFCETSENLRHCIERGTNAEAVVCNDCYSKNRDTLALAPATAAGQAAMQRASSTNTKLKPVPPALFMSPSMSAWQKPSPQPAPKLLQRHVSARGSSSREQTNRSNTNGHPVDKQTDTLRTTSPPPHRRPATRSTKSQDVGEVNLLSDDEDESSCCSKGKEGQRTSAHATRRATERTDGDLLGPLAKLEGLFCHFPPGGGVGSVEVLARDLAKLEPGVFLNDTLIEFYLKHIQSELPPEVANRCHFFSTFFYERLSEKPADAASGYQSSVRLPAHYNQAAKNWSKVRKWTKDVDIFQKDYLFVPVHHAAHWSLVIICHPGRVAQDCSGNDKGTPCILHFDSIQNGHRTLESADRLRAYLWLEYSTKMKKPEENEDPREKYQPLFDRDTFPHFRIKAVKQDNFCDCGLFLCAYVEFFAKYPPPYVNIMETKQMTVQHRKTNCDLFDGTPDCYPGRLNEHWFGQSNAGALRMHMKRLLLSLLTEQNGLQDALSTSADATSSSGPIQSIRKLLAGLDKAESKHGKYLGPREWLPLGESAKLIREEKLANQKAVKKSEGKKRRRRSSQVVVLDSTPPQTSTTGAEVDMVSDREETKSAAAPLKGTDIEREAAPKNMPVLGVPAACLSPVKAGTHRQHVLQISGADSIADHETSSVEETSEEEGPVAQGPRRAGGSELELVTSEKRQEAAVDQLSPTRNGGPNQTLWRKEHSVWEGLGILNSAISTTSPVTYSRKGTKNPSSDFFNL